MSARADNDRGGEVRRGLIATGLGVALGLIAAIFARKERTGERAWRDRSGS